MIKIIAYTTKVIGDDILITDSEGEKVKANNINTLLSFLNEPYSDKEIFAIKVCWNLDETIAPILRKLGTSACRQLASPSHTHKNLFYIPSKVFVIRGQNNQSFFYHLSQYYPNDQEPEDAEDIAGMAENVLEAFRQMGLDPKKLTSPIAIYETEVLNHMQIPTILNIPGHHEELLDYAEECTGRLWIQAYKIGHWSAGDIFEYDIRSAYPHIASRLRSLQYAKYAKSPYMQPDADWGFLRGQVTIYDGVNIHPIFYNTETNNTQPIGTFPATITLHDYRFIKTWEIGDFKLDSGYFIKFTAPVMPMNVVLKRVFKQRGQGGLINDLAKGIATGIYGKFLETHADGNVGHFYNPPYGAMINSICNTQVCEFIYKYNLQNSVVHIGVDSVLAEEVVNLPRPHSVLMGGWRLSGVDEAIVLSSGRVYHGEKKPQGLNYDSIMSLIMSNPRQSYYTANLKRRQTLEESIQLNDLNGLGKIKNTTSSFDLNLIRQNTDRVYEQFPETGQQLLAKHYNSKPIKVHI
jgi:hypothetical protein